MKTSSIFRRVLFASAFIFVQQLAFAQPVVTLSPNTTQNINTGGTVSFTATRNGNNNNWPGGDGNFTYTWSSSPAGVTFTNNPGTGGSNSSTVATFPTAGTYQITCFVQEGGNNGLSATSAATSVVVAAVDPAVAISPSATQSTITGQSITFTGTRNFNWAGGDGTFTYTWSNNVGFGVTFSANGTTTTNTSSSTTATFTSAGTYQLTCTVTENGGGLTVASSTVTINVYAANLWATSSAGTQISAFSVSAGTYNTGPVNLFAASYPGANNTYTRTAALGRNASPSPNNGHFYWLGTSDGGNANDGVVEVFAASATGGTPTKVGSLDMNGASANELGFVRLAVGPEGTAWILAGDGTTLILAKFLTNGVNPTTITVEDASVTLSGGAVSTFQNGDICLSGNGNIYALANDGNGVTQLFLGTPAGANTTLTKRLDLVDENNAVFTGSVNGVAFDLIGSIYLSTSAGLYYINKNTLNTTAATVQCALVRAVTGLQDLASNVWPQNAILPVNLISFTATYNNGRTQLNWESADEVNFSHYEVERMSDTRRGYETVAQKMAAGNSGRNNYQALDDLSSVFETAIYYRLKMVDVNGTFKYSPVVLVRKEKKDLSTLLISPNPISLGNTQATLHFYSGQADQIRVRVLDAAGRPVLQQVNTVNEGTNSVSLQNMHQLQSGFYLIQLQQGASISTTRLVVSK